ncbi:alpha-N-acetylgalactosamine-specific lectin-like [Patiria miniata]|uniref:C-type lectin domain-containing protein n=1 Tax=Patiria miniata TaxID=46514 RepID=A0A914B4L0_PATMI|nr:alpha-N-acetylgalactosamine-specific lectin-like [Patiria miniata]
MFFTNLKMALLIFHLLVSSSTASAQYCSADISSHTKTMCPTGWASYNNASCYLYVATTLSHSEAEAHCQSYSKPGAPVHLASIGSKEENTFIRDANPLPMVAFDSQWIGYVQDQQTGQFVWTDGSRGKYDNWFIRQPSQGPEEHCISMFSLSGTWNDDDCDKAFKFICKMHLRVSHLHI